MLLDFEKIDRLRDEYTGQIVTIDAKIPELKRFIGRQGTVQAITQSGVALVQFQGEDRTRYDIELDYLRVVDRPTEPSSPGESRPAADMGGGSQLSRLEKARLEKS